VKLELNGGNFQDQHLQKKSQIYTSFLFNKLKNLQCILLYFKSSASNKKFFKYEV